MKKFVWILSVIMCPSLYGQSSIHHFTDMTRDIILFEQVQDTIICMRQTGKGVEWSNFNKDLSLISSRTIQTPIRSFILADQLYTTSNALFYIKQRVINNRFEITAKPISINDTAPFTTGKLIHAELIPDDLMDLNSLNYRINTSQNKKFILFSKAVRFDTEKEEVEIVIHMADSSLKMLSSERFFHNIHPQNERLLGVNINNSGKVMVISIERAETYVLGTQLKVSWYDPFTDQLTHRSLKIPREKLYSFQIIDRPGMPVELFASYSPSNTEKDIAGIMRITINETDRSFQVKQFPFTKELVKQVKQKLRANNTKVMDRFEWQYQNISEVPLRSIASFKHLPTLRGNFRSSGYDNAWAEAQERLNNETLVANFYKMKGTKEPMGMQPTSSYSSSSRYVDPLRSVKKDTRELNVILENADKEMDYKAPYHGSMYDALSFPQLYYHSDAGTSLVYTTFSDNSYKLNTARLVNDQLKDRTVIKGTQDLFIDEYISPIHFKDRVIFFYKNATGERSGLIVLK